MQIYKNRCGPNATALGCPQRKQSKYSPESHQRTAKAVTVRAIRPLARAKPTNYRAGADPAAGLYPGFSGSLLISPLYGTCQFPSTCQGLTCPPSVDTAVQMPFGPVK